jgi:hypothetical protein
MMEKLILFLKHFPLEGYIWVSSLVFLTLININSGTHFTICPLSNLGLSFCPGCGLGRSIHYFINLNLTDSFYTHPLGGAAFVILTYRIITLFRKGLQKTKPQISRLKGDA